MLPIFLPIAIPNNVNRNATMPIAMHGMIGLVSKSANVIPTANASMLVAIARRVTSLKVNVSVISSSSLVRLSRIMFNPISNSRMNPIIGAINDTKDVIVLPQRYPIIGINAWNPPKNIAYHSIWVMLRCFCVNPLVIDTLNASIASAIDINIIDIMFSVIF